MVSSLPVNVLHSDLFCKLLQAFNRRLSFIAEWYQEEAAIIRTFTIIFYPTGNAIEVYDQQHKRTFLRRTKMPELSERDFFIGSKINIFGRQFDIVNYADEITKNSLHKYRTKTFLLLKNTCVQHLGAVLCALIDCNFSINRGLMVQFTPEQVKAFLRNKPNVEASSLLNQLIGGPSMGFEVIADNVVQKLKSCQEQSKDCSKDNTIAPLVTLFEREDIRLSIYCPNNEEEAEQDISFFFNPKNGLQATLQLKNSTLAIIKPHCIKEGNLGRIISEITSNGFKIAGLRMNLMERVNCEEFFEVYRGILPEYIPMVAQLASGVSMALEIVCADENKNSYEEFRQFCGPMDPEIAKLLRPHTLRAKFGVNKTLNAVHCTDLPDDTLLELQYVFKILD
ncbi:PREDICTED: nucleoside diphosphate kinase 7 isoform X2 [Rhagoletis zephyria]|uniref:nucleoside diphosphate kinase 7 isoform X2 n=1 Tax=Rhagoletis zephyria TaxID=28612 RepID=UPI00081161A6|nr:PREDICTED: nucleoside diphosphate kinase 7 isoform X2 [Rhagoletis zephyria]